MKFTLTGSLGHISKPLAETLIRQGHTVTVISSNPDKAPAISPVLTAATPNADNFRNSRLLFPLDK